MKILNGHTINALYSHSDVATVDSQIHNEVLTVVVHIQLIDPVIALPIPPKIVLNELIVKFHKKTVGLTKRFYQVQTIGPRIKVCQIQIDELMKEFHAHMIELRKEFFAHTIGPTTKVYQVQAIVPMNAFHDHLIDPMNKFQLHMIVLPMLFQIQAIELPIPFQIQTIELMNKL